MYWARVRGNYEDYYGSWIPTGCTNLDDAKDYLKMFYGPRIVAEWVKL